MFYTCQGNVLHFIINFKNKRKMLKVPTIKFVYNRRGDATKTHPGSVEMRIGHDRHYKYLATGIRLLPKEWKRDRVSNRPDAIELNRSLEKLRNDAMKVINEMIDEGTVNIDEIPRRLSRLHENNTSFIAFCKERAEIRKYGRAEDSQERYDRFIRFLGSYGKLRYFSDITEKNILELDEYLIKVKGLKDNSKWSGYHRFINSFVIDAIAEGYMKRNPYKSLHIPTDKEGKGLHKYLTMEELSRLEKTNMGTESLERVRDLFIFQTYTCLSYVDMSNFDFSKAKNKKGGHMVYTGRRGKTHQEFSFMLLKPAMAVLRKYAFKLPIISNVKYNEYLKVCAQKAGIDKPITSHWARHTGATILLNDGIDMEIVAKVLGHSSTRITRSVYAKLLDDTIVKAMSKIDR